MVTVNSRRKVYSLLRGAFSRDGIAAYIRELIGQRGVTIPLKGDLPKVATIEPWDGKDGEVLITVFLLQQQCAQTQPTVHAQRKGSGNVVYSETNLSTNPTHSA